MEFLPIWLPTQSQAELSVLKQQIGTLRHTYTAECEELPKTIHKQCLGEMIWEALKHWERQGLFICCFTSIYIVNFLYWKTSLEINPEFPSHLWRIKTLSTLTGGQHSLPTPKGETFGLYNAFTHLQTKETLRNLCPQSHC